MVSATGAGLPGGTSRPTSGPGRRCGSATAPGPPTAPGTRSSTRSWSVPTRMVSWTGRSRSTPRSAALTEHGTNLSAPRGALWNHKNLRVEPADHALGRSRGGLSTKIHQLVDGHGLPLVILCGPGQGGDSRMLAPLLNALSVARKGPGAATHETEHAARRQGLLLPATRQTRSASRHQGSHSRTSRPAATPAATAGHAAVALSDWTPRPTAAATSSSVATAT